MWELSTKLLVFHVWHWHSRTTTQQKQKQSKQNTVHYNIQNHQTRDKPFADAMKLGGEFVRFCCFRLKLICDVRIGEADTIVHRVNGTLKMTIAQSVYVFLLEFKRRLKLIFKVYGPEERLGWPTVGGLQVKTMFWLVRWCTLICIASILHFK